MTESSSFSARTLITTGAALLLCASLAACADENSSTYASQDRAGSYPVQPIEIQPSSTTGSSAYTPPPPASPYSSPDGAYDAPPYAYGGTTGSRQTPPPASDPAAEKETFSESEIVSEGEKFFGSAAKGMADAIHTIFARYGEPNAFIRGEEGTGAFVVGLRYGSGELVMKRGGTTPVYWQGPTVGWDFGGNAVKSFTLVYNLPASDAIFQRFPGVEGSAYLVGGISINYQQRGNIVLAPMRAGVGLRLGASVGYLNYTPTRDWLPF